MKDYKYDTGRFINLIEKILIDNGFSEDTINHLIDCYHEPHRFYHNQNHLFSLLEKIEKMHMDSNKKNLLHLIAIFHDSVYQPKRSNEQVNDRYGLLNTGWNEVESIIKFVEACDKDGSTISEEDKMIIIDAIAATGRREFPTEEIARQFYVMDNSILHSSLGDLIKYEESIYKEFQFASWLSYREARIKFLEDAIYRFGDDELHRLIEIIKSRRPKIGIYPGSFNPFHKGHLNILQKAERIFDKVIIVKGVNPDKPKTDAIFPESVSNRQILEWDGLITDLIKELETHSDVTLIRGLRNGKDLDYEVNQLRFMEELYPLLNVCYIQCDKQYEHISSSAIRKLGEFNSEFTKKYLP